jgi:hypothetical protein
VSPHSHSLEEAPVGNDLQLLEDEEDAAADEEGLMLRQRLVEQQQVALTGQGGDSISTQFLTLRVCKRQPFIPVEKDETYLTALVTSANCMRWYFLKSSMVGMWPYDRKKAVVSKILIRN